MSKNTQQEFKIQDKYIIDCGKYGAIYLKDDPSCICDIEHVNNSINEHIQQELTRQKEELREKIESEETYEEELIHGNVYQIELPDRIGMLRPSYARYCINCKAYHPVMEYSSTHQIPCNISDNSYYK